MAGRVGGGSSQGCLALRSIAYHCHLICPSLHHHHPSPPPTLPPPLLLFSGAEGCRENEGQAEIQADRMMECAALMNRIRGERREEEVSVEMEEKTTANKDQQEGKWTDSKYQVTKKQSVREAKPHGLRQIYSKSCEVSRYTSDRLEKQNKQ